MMKSAGVASYGIVHQALTDRDNYERWRIVMQRYLQGQGLWDVVVYGNYERWNAHARTDQASKTMKDGKASHFIELSFGREILETVKKSSLNQLINQNDTDPKSTPDLEQEYETEASWKTKDAKALHIIQLSCERDIFDEISHFETAKEAWNHLAELYGQEYLEHMAGQHMEQAVLDDSLGQQHRLFKMVERGDYIGNMVIDSDVYMTSASGRTLLHVAVIAGNMENVKMLVKKGSDRLLLMQDKLGDTALSLVARYTGNTEMAKCMVETKNGSRERLLEMQNKENVIPILIAAANGHKELTTYLYLKTPSTVFDGDDSQNRVLLLSLCITAEIFDVPLRLLKRYEDLPKESLSIFKFYVPNLLRDSLSLPTTFSKPEDYLYQPLHDKFSSLNALAKMPSAFSSGTRLGFLERIIYDNLSVERKFSDNYGIPGNTNFVQIVTRVAHKRPHSAGWFYLGRKVWLFRFSGRLFWKLVVSIFLIWPIKLLGVLLDGLFRGIAYLLVQIFDCLNIFGIRKIYDQKYIHYEVMGILRYFSLSIGEFNYLQLKEASAYEAMLHAAQHGIIEFINTMRHANPDLLLAVDSSYRGIFSYAIVYRKHNVFQLIHSLHERKKIFISSTDVFGSNMLHLTAYLGSSSDCDSKSGAALQMQREIQWFKAVEKVVHPQFKEAKDGDGKMPYEIFTENHKELVKTGEKWAKATAQSYTIVGTLITTIMFAAVFTVPGGNNQETGLPIFLHDNIFTIFLIADAFSLFTSATSNLIFIGILASRYSENDFLKSLPWKLMFGVLFFSLSLCSMIVAFCAAIVMILKGYRTYKWFIVAPTMSLGSIPIIILLLSQLHLVYKIFNSTWRNPIDTIKK